MAALNVPGFGDVIVQPGITEGSNNIGDYGRAFSGAGRSDVRATKRAWPFVTGEYTAANARSLRDILNGNGPLSCSGDVLGGTVSCHAQNVRIAWTSDGATVVGMVSFELHEV